MFSFSFSFSPSFSSGAQLMFSQSSYNVTENVGAVRVCVVLGVEEATSIPIWYRLFTVNGTAEGDT